ncbi:MAG: dTDP-4-dehydrorhamnose 3,5-epimerase-like enzyme [Ilumatobacter sp.]
MLEIFLPVIQCGLSSGTQLEGVRSKPIIGHSDRRGSFAEYFVGPDEQIAPGQWSIVYSDTRVLRGRRVHPGHDELFALISGRVTVGLHGLRAGSSTAGVSATFEFTTATPTRLVFPRGIQHGWLFHTDSIQLQATSAAHHTYHPHEVPLARSSAA